MFIRDNQDKKELNSSSYNFKFDKKSGFFMRWGKNKDDDPDYSPYGPEIADIEVTTSCSGPAGKVCVFCYKANTPRGTNMSFGTFKKVFANLPKTITQIAFGADANLTSNPDIWKMFDYCRENGVVPNVTVANITKKIAERLTKVCGGVAVSRYHNKNWCYDSVQHLTDAGMNQINIHMMLSEETFDQAIETINDRLNDPRLAGLHAIVFLSLKQVGRGTNNSPLSLDRFNAIIQHALNQKVNFGMDSCSANKFVRVVKDHDDFDAFSKCVEPCESTCFSLYCNTDGHFFPCSFSEGNGKWVDGIDMTKEINFLDDVWNNTRTKEFRSQLLNEKDENHIRTCPLFEI